MANQKIRQEISFFNRRVIFNAETAPDRIYYDPDDYNGATVYFEAIIAFQTGSPSCRLVDSDDNIHASILSITGSDYHRYRVSVDTALTVDEYRVYGGGTNMDIQAARIIILQDAAAITDTSTQIELGSYEAITWETGYQSLTYPKYWYYDSAKWDGSVTFDFHVSTINSDSKGDLYVQLEYSSDFSSWSAVSGSQITTTSETAIITRATGLTLTDKRWYRIAANLENDMYGATIYNAKVVVNQTDATQITKCQPEYLLINRGNLAASANHDFDTYYDPAEWDEGGGTLNFIHAQDVSDDASSVKCQDMSGPTDLEGSDLLGNESSVDQQSMSIYPVSLDFAPTGTTNIYDGGTAEGIAGTFVATGGFCIGIGVYMIKVGSPGTATIGLYAIDGSNLPTGSALASVNITASDVDTSPDWRFFYFDTPYATTDGTTYASTIIHNAGNVSNCYRIYYAASGRGQGSYTDDAGSSWSVSANSYRGLMPIEAIDMPGSAQTIDSYIVAV